MFKDTAAFSSFSVDNVEKARNFYEGTLGLEVEQDDSVGMPMLHLKLAGGGKVMLYPKDDHQPATFTVLNFSVDDLDSTVDELNGKGVKFEQYDQRPIKTDDKGIARDPEGRGPAIAWFKDPAGNVIAVMKEN